MLRLEHLEIRQTDFRLTADWQVARGARVAVLGPSGAGKSTLIGAIAGFVPLASGRVMWEGLDLTALPPGERPLSIMFQDSNLFPHLSVARNLALWLGAQDAAAIGRALARVGLAGMEARAPGTLSGGQQSRVALAGALLRARPLLLLDEPFAALGPGMRAEMLALVREIAAETGATVMMVTHDPQDALRLGGETVLVADGRADPPRDTGALFADPPPALRDWMG